MSMNGNTMTMKSCVTKDKIAKGAAFSDSRSSNGDCTRSVVKSSATHMEAKFHCDSKNGTSDGNVIVDIAGDIDADRARKHADLQPTDFAVLHGRNWLQLNQRPLFRL